MYAQPPVEGHVEFRAVLPPAHVAARPDTGTLTVASIILAALWPLQADLDTALAHDDGPAALGLAYRALVPLADALAAYTGCPLQPGQARVQALLVELEPLPFLVHADGTLAEQGAAVTIYYRHWRLTPAEANRWARQLSREFQARWPNARVMVSDN